MQVKKFEARTMKEALEMVKVQLGPDAIILGVRDNKKSFGLVGDGSIEITAAVSEETLHKKKFAESRIREEEKKKLSTSPARVQKQFINKVVDNYTKEKEPPRPVTRTRYIDIGDEGMESALTADGAASERIRGAAQRAWSAFQDQTGPLATTATRAAGAPSQRSEIDVLKNEIASLRQVIKTFQAVPQTIAPAVSSHPGASYGLGYEVSHMFEKLTQAGISEDIAAEILTLAQEQMPPVKLKSKALVDAWVAKYILETTKIVNDKNHSKIHLFFGPTGSGKTSMLVKWASHLVIQDKKKIAILSADSIKVGAIDQLKIYSQILNVPFATIRSASDWNSIHSQLSHFDHILVDFPGLSLKTMEENSILRSLLPTDSGLVTTHLVLEATAKDQDILEMGRRYKPYGFNDALFTGLDQSVQHGTIYNFMKKFDVPLHSFGLGSRVPEDFEMATKERVLDIIFKLSSLRKI